MTILLDDLNTLLASPKTYHIVAYTTVSNMATLLADSVHDFAYQTDGTPGLYVKSGGAWVAANATITASFTNATIGQDAPDAYYGIQSNGVIDGSWPPAIGSGNTYIFADWATLLANAYPKVGEIAVVNNIPYMLGVSPASVGPNWVKLKSSALLSYTGDIITTKTISDSLGNVRNIPVKVQASAYTLIASDTGKIIKASGTVTVPNNIFTAGNIVTLYNGTGTNLTVTLTGLTAYVSGSATAATSATIAARGVAYVHFITGSEVILDGKVT